MNKPISIVENNDGDDSFDDFTDPSQPNSNVDDLEGSNSININENFQTPELKQASQSTPYDDAWANFEQPDQNTDSKGQPDNSWSDFSGPSKQVFEDRKGQLKTENDNDYETGSKSDPFDSALLEPNLQKGVDQKDNLTDQSNIGHEEKQDQGSDFDDFVNPSQTDNKFRNKNDLDGSI